MKKQIEIRQSVLPWVLANRTGLTNVDNDVFNLGISEAVNRVARLPNLEEISQYQEVTSETHAGHARASLDIVVDVLKKI